MRSIFVCTDVKLNKSANAKVHAENDTSIIELRSSLPYKDGQWSPVNTSGKKVYDKEFLLALRDDPKSRKKPENLLDVVAQEDKGKLQSPLPIFSPQSGPFLQSMWQVPWQVQPMYCMPYYGSTGQRPAIIPQYFPGQTFTTISYPQTPQQTQTYLNYPQYLPRGAQPQNSIPPPPTLALPPASQQQVGQQRKRRANAIPTIDPESGRDKLDIIFVDNSHPSSGESSPQPQYISNKEVQNTFNKQGNMVINQEKMNVELEQSSSPSCDQGIYVRMVNQTLPSTPQTIHILNKELVQTSKLQLPTKQLIQLRNKTNGKLNAKNKTNSIELRPSLPYKDDQWSPVNTSGKKVYDKEFLLALRNDPKSRKKPENLPDVVAQEDRGRVGLINYFLKGGKPTHLTPNFSDNNYGENSLSNQQKNILLKRNNQQSKSDGKAKEDKTNNVISSTSIRGDVDLNKSENAKVNAERDTNNIELRLSLPYKDDQWSPVNTNGKKVYDKKFLLALRNDPKSRKKPENLPDVIAQEDKGRAMKTVRITSQKHDRSTSDSNTGKPSTRNTSTQKGRSLQIDQQLGSDYIFNGWICESNIKTINQQAPPMGTIFAGLETVINDVEKRSLMNYGSEDSYHSRGTSFEGRESGSGLQHRPHESSHRSKPMSSQQNILKSNPSSAPKPRQTAAEQASCVKLDQLERKIKNILEGYLKDCYTVDECDKNIRTSLSTSILPKLVTDSYIYVLQRSTTAREKTGRLIANLVKRSTLSINSYCTGLEEVLSRTVDFTIEIPNIWDYLAEILAPIINEDAVSLVRLHKSFDIIIKGGHTSKLLGPLLKLVITAKGPNYLHSLWQNSGITIFDFMDSSQARNFIQVNKLEFLLGGSNTVINENELTYEQIHIKLLDLLKNENSLDDVFRWIDANIGKRSHEKQFVRTLATAVFENSIVKSRLKTENLRNHYSLLIRFIDGRLEYELECLYAVQALINKLERPQDILLSICNSLYDDGIIGYDSFVKWETSDNVAE